MSGVTIDRIKKGCSQIRNRALTHAFPYMNLIEGWGTRIPRLIRQVRDYGLKEPYFVDIDISLKIILYCFAGAARNGVLLSENALKAHNYGEVGSKCT